MVVACTHTCCNDKAKISFADVVVKHVLINGIHDEDIGREVPRVLEEVKEGRSPERFGNQQRHQQQLCRGQGGAQGLLPSD